MIQTLYTGATGLTGQQKNLDVISNNIANLNTDGFKRSRFDFKDCLYLRMRSPVDNSYEKNLQRGAGTAEYQIARMFNEGAIRDTGEPLDFALRGNGFFILENPNPLDLEDETDLYVYTRSGNFYLSPEEGDDGHTGGYLVNANGYYVLDEDYERIYIENPAELSVGNRGELLFLNEDNLEEEFAVLGIVDFTNRSGLAAMGDNMFVYTENAGEELFMEDIDTKVIQRSLESGNVDLAEEMTRMIRAQRAYQIASRVVSVADQMMQQVNNIRQ